MTIYALKHPDGRHIYNLPLPSKKTGFGAPRIVSLTADTQEMTHLRGDWWTAPNAATRFTATFQPKEVVTGYALDDPSAESSRYPATLTPEERRDRPDGEDEILWQLYSPTLTKIPGETHTWDGPVVYMEGREPPQGDEPQWIADLPHQLADRPEYLHLFPGRIPGLREHVYQILDRRPGILHCFKNYNGNSGIHVAIEVGYDKPRTRWLRNISRRTGKPLKTGKNVPEKVTRRIDLPVPTQVTGENYEQALTEWNRQVEFWIEVVDSATVKACSACNGTGHVNDGIEGY